MTLRLMLDNVAIIKKTSIQTIRGPWALARVHLLSVYSLAEGEDFMGITKWLAKRGPAGKIAKAVFSQYQDVINRFPEQTEAQIATNLFIRGYITGTKLDKRQSSRFFPYFQQLMDGDAQIESIYELCLKIIEIEMNITPSDGEPYYLAKDIISEELRKLGYK